VYVLLGNELTAGKAFVAISLFNILRFPLAMLPRVVMNFIQVCSASQLTSLHLTGPFSIGREYTTCHACVILEAPLTQGICEGIELKDVFLFNEISK